MDNFNFIVCLLAWSKVSLWSPGWPWTQIVPLLQPPRCWYYRHVLPHPLWKVKILELGSLLTASSPLVPSLTCLCLPSVVPATTHSCESSLLPVGHHGAPDFVLMLVRITMPGKGMEGSMRLTVCALHRFSLQGHFPNTTQFSEGWQSPLLTSHIGSPTWPVTRACGSMFGRLPSWDLWEVKPSSLTMRKLGPGGGVG